MSLFGSNNLTLCCIIVIHCQWVFHDGYFMSIVNGYFIFMSIVNGYLMFIVNGYRISCSLSMGISCPLSMGTVFHVHCQWVFIISYGYFMFIVNGVFIISYGYFMSIVNGYSLFHRVFHVAILFTS